MGLGQLFWWSHLCIHNLRKEYFCKVFSASIANIYPPGYPALIAVVQAFGAADLQVFKFVQICFDLTACLLVYTVLRGLGTGRGAGVIGAALYAFAPWWASGSTYILAEALVPALVLLLLTLLLRARRRQQMWDWAFCGFGAALVDVVSARISCPSLSLWRYGVCLLLSREAV